MKKIMVLAVAMFAMATATFAADEETNATAAYNMNIKMSRSEERRVGKECTG